MVRKVVLISNLRTVRDPQMVDKINRLDIMHKVFSNFLRMIVSLKGMVLFLVIIFFVYLYGSP